MEQKQQCKRMKVKFEEHRVFEGYIEVPKNGAKNVDVHGNLNPDVALQLRAISRYSEAEDTSFHLLNEEAV